MNETHFFALIHELWRDIQKPDFLWQAAALCVSLAIAWWLARRLRQQRVNAAPIGRSGLRDFGYASVKRLAFPLIALLGVVIFRSFLKLSGNVSLLDLAIPLLVAMALVRATIYLLRRAFSPSGWLATSERFVAVTVWLGLAIYIVGLAGPLIGLLEQVNFSVGKQKLDLWIVVHGALTVLVTVLVALWGAGLIEARLSAAEQMDSNLRVVLARVTKALLAIVALLLSLSLVGIDVTALSVFGGALAVGLGFGLQKIASNYVSGFIILLDRSIRIGNLISVDGATSGIVSQITTRYTVVRTLSGTELIVPNEYLVANIVQNQSYTDSRVRLVVPLQVAYGTDLELAMGLMEGAARAHARVLADPAPGVLLRAFADSGINLELGFWIADPEMGTGNVCSDISLAIWKSFQAAAVEIPYPRRDLRIIGAEAERLASRDASEQSGESSAASV